MSTIQDAVVSSACTIGVPDREAKKPVKLAPANGNDLVIVTSRKGADVNVGSLLVEAAQRTGRSPAQMMIEFAKLAFGPGKISFEEYLSFGLYKDGGADAIDKAAFAGLKGMRPIWAAANYDSSWHGLFHDKIAMEVLFRGFGFPVPRTIALYSATRKLPGLPVLGSEEALAAFLRTPSSYPLFGKPNDSLQSLGSASFESYDAGSDKLHSTLGKLVEVEDFAKDITSSYAAGYLFQKRLSPHSDVRALCGNRLATVRIMTTTTRKGTELLCAAWKIPAGENVADNFWRPGNLIAQLDLETGRVLRVVCGTGLKSREVEAHPDTGARLVGAQVPDWHQCVTLALEGARVLKSIALIGWDIAPSESGPLIVEPNCTPDFTLPQIANGRGLLDGRIAALVAERKADALAAKKEFKRQMHRERIQDRERMKLKLSAN